MPRKRIPIIIFDQVPEYGHYIMVKGHPYWFLRANTTNNTKSSLLWMTLCSRCHIPFEEESGLLIYWLHKRCQRHRRKQPTLNDKISYAKRTLRKFQKYAENLSS